MMPRTLAAFGLALMVLVFALLVPPPAEPGTPSRPLDLDGVTVVEVRSDRGPVIRFNSGTAPSLHQDDPEATVELTRSGDRLVIRAQGHGYMGLSMDLPDSVSTLVLPGGRVEAVKARGPLEIRTTAEINWEGDIAGLRILDVRGPSALEEGGQDPAARAAARAASGCYGDCNRFINVQSGRIDRLDVELRRGVLHLFRADLVGEADVLLGPDAWLAVEQARDLRHIRVRHQADVEAPAAESETSE